MITYDCIIGYFNQLTRLPERNIFSPAGFAALAEWSERQPWWGSFADHHRLGGNWRSTPMGDGHLFVLNLYRFLNSPDSLPGR
jgi:hypothetical protein